MAVGPTLSKVLNALPDDKKVKLHHYQQNHAFHRGRQWFGVGMRISVAPKTSGGETKFVMSAMNEVACPVAAAFDVELDRSNVGWFSAKLDEHLMAAIKHIIETVGKSEDGMEQYLKELENTDPVELYKLVEAQALGVVNSKTSKR